MATTKITSNVLALSAAQTNINNDGSFTLSVPTQINNTLSLSGNLTVDTNTLFVDSVNNRVGIGTNNPLQAIDFRPVTFNASQSGGIRFDNTSGTWPCGIYIRSDGVGGPRLSLDAPYQTNTLNLYNNNVGIGTITPTAKLTVVGNISATGNLTVDTNTLFVDAAGDKVGIGTASSLIGKLDVAGSPTTTSSTDVLVLSRPYNPGVGFHTAASFKLSNPSSSVNNTRLDIALMQGNTLTPITPDTTVMTLLGNGNVGIGTTSPVAKFHVSEGISRFDRSGVVFNITPNYTGLGNVALDVTTNNGIIFRTNNIDRAIISNTGSVGIGTTTPNEKLTVSGNLSASGDAFSNGAKLAAETFAIAMAIAVG